MKCMFCDKEILSNEEAVFSPFNDGTDSHKACGDNAVKKLIKQ